MLIDGLRALGLVPFIDDELQAPIIVTFHSPADPNFEFETFYDKVKAQGFALYPGKLRIEYRHLPLNFHENAIPAAKAAICAGNQNQFWEYHLLLFGNQKALGPESLLSYATKLDLDSAKFKACIAAPETLARVNEDIALARSLGVSASPTFFVTASTDVEMTLDELPPAIDASAAASSSGFGRHTPSESSRLQMQRDTATFQ